MFVHSVSVSGKSSCLDGREEETCFQRSQLFKITAGFPKTSLDPGYLSVNVKQTASRHVSGIPAEACVATGLI